jgi:hypothetical protein
MHGNMYVKIGLFLNNLKESFFQNINVAPLKLVCKTAQTYIQKAHTR